MSEKSSAGAMVMPVGKYKDQPIEMLAKDPEYMDWLISQKWFREKFQSHYTVIINNFSVPSETPEHNAMQAKFLDISYINSFTEYAADKFGKEYVEVLKFNFEPLMGGDVWLSFCYGFKLEEWCEDHRDCIKREGCKGWKSEKVPLTTEMIVEIKPSIGDDYPAVLRAAKRIRGISGVCVLIKKYSGEGASIEQVKEMFGRSGILLVEESEFRAG